MNYEQRKTRIIPKKTPFCVHSDILLLKERKMRFNVSLLDRLTVQAKTKDEPRPAQHPHRPKPAHARRFGARHVDDHPSPSPHIRDHGGIKRQGKAVLTRES